MDLLLVIRWIKQQIGKRTGFTEQSLRFSTLLQLDYFKEKLMLARHQMRAQPARTRDQCTCIVKTLDGNTISILDEEKPLPVEVITARDSAAEELFALGRRLKNG